MKGLKMIASQADLYGICVKPITMTPLAGGPLLSHFWVISLESPSTCSTVPPVFGGANWQSPWPQIFHRGLCQRCAVLCT